MESPLQLGLLLSQLVSLVEGGATKVRSECALKTMCTDFGKNEKNVKRILAELPNHYVAG
jgi:hypothetical protein